MTSARELERAYPFRFRVRTAVRRAALEALTRIPRTRPRGIRIVHYHFVFGDELRAFERQLEWFRSEFEPVSLSEAVTRLRGGDVRGSELVITFDDGFKNQAATAAPLLREAGFSACFFLVTELVEAPPERARELCRVRLHLPRPVEPMGWDDARGVLELGHEVGSHTRTHPDLASLPADEIARELRESRAELEARLGRPVLHVSAPYGRAANVTPQVSRAASETGYLSCASAQRGINAADADPYALRRDHLVAGWSVRDVRYFLSR